MDGKQSHLFIQPFSRSVIRALEYSGRLLRHNGNKNKFTRNKGPWELSTSHTCSSKSEAYKTGIRIKRNENSAKAIEYLKKVGSEHSDF